MKVGLLTLEQKNEIEGKFFAPDSMFEPIEDADGNWVISIQEIEQSAIPQYEWVHELPLIDYKPK